MIVNWYVIKYLGSDADTRRKHVASMADKSGNSGRWSVPFNNTSSTKYFVIIYFK